MAEGHESKRTSKPIYIGQERFESLAEAALALGLKKATLYRRLRSGYTEEQLRAPIEYTTGERRRTAKSVTIDGVRYHSIQEAADQLGISYQTLHSRLKNGMDSKKISAQRRVNRKETPIKYCGATYPTMKAFCDQYGYSYSKMKYYTAKGMSLEAIIKKIK